MRQFDACPYAVEYLGKSRHGEGCTPGWSDCRRIEKVKLQCPSCFEEGHAVRLQHDPETGFLHCPACESDWLSALDRDLDWARMTREIYGALEPQPVEG